MILASYATGAVAGGDSGFDYVGGLVGYQEDGLILASYATGAVAGGGGTEDSIGGLVGQQDGGSITASYATGAVAGGDDGSDLIGGLLGYQDGGSITASYATGAVGGGDGGNNSVGGLVGYQEEDGSSITASYGFGRVIGGIRELGTDGSAKPQGVSTAAQLTAANAGSAWNNAGSNTLGAWDFGIDGQFLALNYADYDGDGPAFNCDQFPADACGPPGILLPGQERSLVFSPSPLSLVEGEMEGGRYSLVLISPPASPVTVRLSVGGDEGSIRLEDAGGAVVSELSFDATSWDQTRTVRVLAVNDNLSNGRRTARISHEIETSDPDYPGVAFTPVVEVRIDDDDPVPGVRLVLVPKRHGEGSSDDGLGETEVSLRVRAVLDVDGPLRSAATTLTLSFGAAGDSAVAGVDYRRLLSSPELVIAPLDRESKDLGFSLFLIQDEIDEGAGESFTVAITADFDTETRTAVVFFTIEDDDEAGVEVRLRPQMLQEGDVLSWEVVLSTEPTAAVMVMPSVVRPAGSEARVEDLAIAPASLTFTDANWNSPQEVMITVAPSLEHFGELEIRHELTSMDANYQGLIVPPVTLELSNVDASLQVLTLRLAAGGDPLSLVGADDAPAVEGFDPIVLQYSAEVPFGDGQIFLTATPAVTQDVVVAGTLVQKTAEVRLFRRLPSGGDELLEGDDIAGRSDIEVDLPAAEDEFVLLAEVSVLPLATEVDGVTRYQTYTLTLRRALPADAELVIFLAAPGDAEEKRRMPLTAATPVEFAAADDSMELIFVVRDRDGTSYAIDEVSFELSPVADAARLVVDVGEQTKTEDGDFATPVTLSRDPARTAGTFTFALTFKATPERPLAMNAEDLTAAISGVLLDNADTETQFRATWRGQDQEMDRPLEPGADLTVSANGTLTIVLRVERSGGGVRSFEQSSFPLSVSVDPASADDRVKLNGNILEIAAGTPLGIEITAAPVDPLRARINSPAPLSFSVVFEQPRALIRAVAAPDPLFAFGDLLFAFVDKEKRLPLEVVLEEDSVPLANSDSILRGLVLTLTAPITSPSTTLSIEGSVAGDFPGRDLLFNVAAAQNAVSFEVAVAEQSELVDVAPLNFGAHFLSLEHEDEVDFLSVSGAVFVPDFKVVEIALRGETAGIEDEIWTLAVANAVDLENDGYEVAEVVFESPETRIYSIVRQEVSMEGTPTWSVQMRTFNVIAGVEVEEAVTEFVAAAAAELPAGALLRFSEDAALRTLTLRVGGAAAVYSIEDLPADAVTRTLRIRRLRSDAENSSVVLRFGYSPPANRGDAGEFIRIIELETGVAAELRVEVHPETLVLPRGGLGTVTLVVGNLALGEDPSEFISLSHSADVQIGPPDGELAGELDAINRRFEQVLEVRVAPEANQPNYEVQVEVRLPGKALGRARFRVDLNDPPRYEGQELLMVLENGEEQEYLLTIVDPDGGTELLNPAALALEVVSFGSDTPVQDLSHRNDYFDVAAGDVMHEIGDESAATSGNRNSLAVTLTLTGKLATPYGSVVELRLYGVRDGYDELNQRLVVRVVDVPPTFELETTTIAVFPDQAAVSLPVEMFSDGSRDGPATGLRILVLETPDDLVVKFDSAGGDLGAITLRRLNASRNGPAEVKLVVLDAQGGRTEVTIEVQRPPLLPQIVPPHPLFIAAGDMQTRQVRLAGGDTELDVTWTAEPETAGDMLEVAVRTLPGGHAEVAVTASASASATGEVLALNLTATADNGLFQKRQALLPVVVVAAAPRPRLQLSLSAADPDNPADPTARVTVSSLLLTETETLFVGATLAGAMPPGLDLLAFTIRITKIGADGTATGPAFELMATSTFSVDPFSLEASVAVNRLTGAGSVELVSMEMWSRCRLQRMPPAGSPATACACGSLSR